MFVRDGERGLGSEPNVAWSKKHTYVLERLERLSFTRSRLHRYDSSRIWLSVREAGEGWVALYLHIFIINGLGLRSSKANYENEVEVSIPRFHIQSQNDWPLFPEL